jgi:hypothetical protein
MSYNATKADENLQNLGNSMKGFKNGITDLTENTTGVRPAPYQYNYK